MAGRRATRSATAIAVTALAAAVIATSAGASQPKSQLTSAGNALAKGVVLKVSDLGAGWKASSGSGTGTELTCKSFNPNQSDLTAIGSAGQSFASTDGVVTMLSRALVFKTAAQAQASWSRLVRPAMLGCLASTLESLLAGKDTTVEIVSKKPLSLKVPGRRHAAYRIVADVTLGGETVKAYLDVILQGGGQADTAVLITSVSLPPAKALETKLAAALAGRLPK